MEVVHDAELTKQNILLSASNKAKSGENWFWRVIALSAILWGLFKPKIISSINKAKKYFHF
jgi:hypothetical protein